MPGVLPAESVRSFREHGFLFPYRYAILFRGATAPPPPPHPV